MKAQNVIIVTSGQAQYADAESLDRTIGSILEQGKAPILVLGPDGDDLLRLCSKIDECEMVFDPNFEGGFFSGVHAGICAAKGAAFVIRFGQPMESQSVWQLMEKSLATVEAQNADVLCPLGKDGAARWDFSLITLRGLKNLRRLSAASAWENNPSVVALPVAVTS